jgi:hypothetical protein
MPPPPPGVLEPRQLSVVPKPEPPPAVMPMAPVTQPTMPQAPPAAARSVNTTKMVLVGGVILALGVGALLVLGKKKSSASAKAA